MEWLIPACNRSSGPEGGGGRLGVKCTMNLLPLELFAVLLQPASPYFMVELVVMVHYSKLR